MEVTHAGLAGQPFVEESTCNGVDYTFDLLGWLVFLFLRRLSIASLLMVSLSPLIFGYVPSSVGIVVSMLIILVCSRSRSC